ncbi:MAG: glutamine-hydrolyzing GMP synthase [Parcubacteria group bacterium]|nr:glutamine-hydrolyzing GMP synthase [Parcubacteria group bacterium]
MKHDIAIIDLGGQYCHMISRRLREIGVLADILPPTASAGQLADYAGVILSGGPRSVYEEDAPKIDRSILGMGKPVLGICYGHQLMAKMLGARVEPAHGEFGPSTLTLQKPDSLFRNTPESQPVWMSHTDSVRSLPRNFVRLAKTNLCKIAAFGNVKRKLFGVQFHPEVGHTKHGYDILRNFALNICGIGSERRTTNLIDHLVAQIRSSVGNRSVFFFVSGGVDSAVAFTLCARALPKNRLFGVYVDTGLMRKKETEEFTRLVKRLGLTSSVKIRDESNLFLKELRGIIDPEKKRDKIGRSFVAVQKKAMSEYGIDEKTWLLGQGTIYPDTIESGGKNGSAAVIKTHHNRCAEIRRMLDKGLVIEPIAEFYKDEVRKIGKLLGLDRQVTERWPFPGPGLAIRCLCTPDRVKTETINMPLPAFAAKYKAVGLPLNSVGVQGDARTYSEVVALSGPMNYAILQRIGTHLCNVGQSYNRVIYLLWPVTLDLSDIHVAAGKTLTEDRLNLLRKGDYIARKVMERRDLLNSVWQFPVVLAPLSSKEGESIILRPVKSKDGMTANFAQLSKDCLWEIATKIGRLKGVDAVFLDVTNKPPATIEWE